ncbi:MAG: cytochrome c nitrite reductase small subunit [Bacteroidota bacterium]
MIRQLNSRLYISRWFFILLGAAIGLAGGIGSYTFIYAKGYSYLTDDPAACANCHSMNEQYSGWMKGSHRSVAKCNDCHTPSGFVGKYMTKASNGFWHSFYFTTGWYPNNIQINKHNVEIAEEACQKCHQDIVDAIDRPHQHPNKTPCIYCHTSVGHME